MVRHSDGRRRGKRPRLAPTEKLSRSQRFSTLISILYGLYFLFFFVMMYLLGGTAITGSVEGGRFFFYMSNYPTEHSRFIWVLSALQGSSVIALGGLVVVIAPWTLVGREFIWRLFYPADWCFDAVPYAAAVISAVGFIVILLGLLMGAVPLLAAV